MPSNLLIVDDEPFTKVIYRQRFRKEVRQGLYEFQFAANGAEALAYLGKHPEVKVLISDISMPEMDGFSLLTHLKNEFPYLRAIVASAYCDPANIQKALDHGAFGFLAKPLDLDQLADIIKKALHEKTDSDLTEDNIGTD